MHVFRLGDRVRLVKKLTDILGRGPSVGAEGTVLYRGYLGDHIGVRWDVAFPGGHDGNGSAWCDPGHGWYVHEHVLRYIGWRVNPAKVVPAPPARLMPDMAMNYVIQAEQAHRVAPAGWDDHIASTYFASLDAYFAERRRAGETD
jgi:hypothetical protein